MSDGPGSQAPSQHSPGWARGLTLLACCLALGCGSAPRVADWQIEARDALDRATEAYLTGRDTVAEAEFRRARETLSGTAQPAAVARAELRRCAARLASLDGLTAIPHCDSFEPWRADSPADLRAYADWMSGLAVATELLPAAQRAAASAAADAVRREAAIRAIEDPLSRLLAAALAVREAAATPAVLVLAVDTASAQGWRRPLLAWLTLQLKRVEAAVTVPGTDEATRQSALAAAAALRRRIELLAPSAAVR